MAFAAAAALADVWAGEMKACVVQGRRVVLLRKGDHVVAFEDRCAHLGIPMSTGTWEGDVLTCCAHGWSYEAMTGQGVNPKSARLHRFACKVEGDKILVDVEQPG
jgi:toluene monooxygenase system ferredoxin subunit